MPVYQAYAVKMEFPFINRIQQILDILQSSGLFQKWTNDHVLQGYKNIRKGNENAVGESTVSEVPLYEYIVYGWAASCVVFAIELAWHKLSKAKFQFRRNVRR